MPNKFLWYLSNLRVKSPITQIIENNIFKELNFGFESQLLFDLRNLFFWKFKFLFDDI